MITPAFAAVVVGLVVAMSLHGALGLIMGPLELLGAVGNVLSYLRLAADGLASVYLANVANELAVAAPLLLGVVIAAFFHALNLALAAFSPMIQSLRLHYVEFFTKFYVGGGRPFRPLGGRAPLPLGTPPPPVAPMRPTAFPPPLPSLPPGPDVRPLPTSSAARPAARVPT